MGFWLILLTILKIIGIIIASVLVLLLLIVLMFIIGKPLIESRLVKIFSSQLLDVPTITEQVATTEGKDEQIRRLAESLAMELDATEKKGGGL